MTQPRSASLDWDSLPIGLRLLRGAIGAGPTLALARAGAGGRMYIPLSPEAGHPVTRLLGPELAARLCANLGGRSLRIPKPECWGSRLDRVEAIRGARAAGRSVADISSAFGLSRRRVQQILAG